MVLKSKAVIRSVAHLFASGVLRKVSQDLDPLITPVTFQFT